MKIELEHCNTPGKETNWLATVSIPPSCVLSEPELRALSNTFCAYGETAKKALENLLADQSDDSILEAIEGLDVETLQNYAQNLCGPVR